MESSPEPADLQKHGKFSNWKRKGKLSEMDRLKKRQKELHIMKLSQEWDARRHKRKMDRIQWLQQRKDQTSPPDEATETPKRREDALSETQSGNILAHTNTNYSPVSACSSQEHTYDSQTEEPPKPMANLESTRMEENASSLCEDTISKSADNAECSTCSSPNQVYKSVVVKTERIDPERFSNSNYMSVSRQSNSRNANHIPTENRKRRKKVRKIANDSKLFLSNSLERFNRLFFWINSEKINIHI